MALNITQALALEGIYRKLLDELYNYAEGRLDPVFFFDRMESIIRLIDGFVRENGSHSCSHQRDLKTADKFLLQNKGEKK
jgi:hypothetical protein